MQLEIKYLIQAALSELASNLTEDLERKIWDEAIRKIKIEKPPQKVKADFTSPVVFELASVLRQSLQADFSISVNELGEKLVQQIKLELNKREAYFSVELSEGHLNFCILQVGKDLFLNRLIGRGIDCLFRENALLIENTPYDTKAIRPLPKVTFYREQFLKRVQAGNDHELKKFLSTLDRAIENKWSDTLMLLAASADKELSLHAYQNDLKGMENVPWLCERFSQDVKNVLRGGKTEQSLSCSRKSRSSLEGEQIREISKLYQAISQPLGLVAETLFEVRNELISSEAFRAPEIAVNVVLRIVRGFYSYYNLPQCRALCAMYPSSREFGRVAELTDIFSLLVQKILSELKMSFDEYRDEFRIVKSSSL